jgi:hypothetical protein
VGGCLGVSLEAKEPGPRAVLLLTLSTFKVRTFG